MIDREEALRIGEAEIAARGLGTGASKAVLLEEITWRRPSLVFIDQDMGSTWIVYAIPKVLALRASNIVIISRETGAVLYAGSANDEG